MKYDLYTLILLLFCYVANAQESHNCMSLREVNENNLPFQCGEQLTIVANYRWGLINTDVGEAVFVLKKERFRGIDVFYARAEAKTYRFYDRIFRVRDVYEGRFRQDNLRPTYFHRDVSEGNYTMKNTYHFNQDNDSIRSTIQRRTSDPKRLVIGGKPCTFDLVSLLYNSRHVDIDNLKPGQLVPMAFAIDDEVFDIHYRYIGKETKKISGLGTFYCHKVAVRPVAGEVFDGKNEVFIWISDDENRLPLYIETPIRVGKVSARLSKFENLKSPLNVKK
jgi:hypothetical protein